jgi:cobalamin-dependent methionine synthase I
MPQNIHPPHARATTDEISQLREDIADLTKVVHALARAQPETNPAAPATGDGLLLQLLLDERRRGDERDAELRQLQNPLHQLDQLQALADFVQPAQDENQLLTGALEALGGVIASSVEQNSQTTGSPPPTQPDASNDPGEY